MDIVKGMENILPILIFVIWIIVSLAAGSKKRKNSPRPQQPQTERTTYSSQDTQAQTDSDSSQISDELRKTLETIFNDKEPVEEKTPQSEPEPSYQDSESIEQKTATDYSDLLEEQDALQARFDELQNRKSSVAEVTAPQMSPVYNEDDTSGDFSVSQDELRKGVLWSEILAKPVSMRA